MNDQAYEADRQVAVRHAYRVSADGLCPEERNLVREAPLLVQVNGQPVAVVMRTPGMDAELSIGFCVCEGVVASADDVASVAVVRSCQGEPIDAVRCAGERWLGDMADIQLARGAISASSADRVRMVRAVAGDPETCSNSVLPSVRVDVRVGWQALAAARADFDAAQTLRKRAGGVHGFGLYRDSGERLVVCEDVGRHNAMDKAIGWCLRHRLGDAWAFGLCSGRLSYEMVAKAARAELPILVSFSAPSSLGVLTAERCEITVVGYLEDSQALAYSHPERLVV